MTLGDGHRLAATRPKARAPEVASKLGIIRFGDITFAYSNRFGQAQYTSPFTNLSDPFCLHVTYAIKNNGELALFLSRWPQSGQVSCNSYSIVLESLFRGDRHRSGCSTPQLLLIVRPLWYWSLLATANLVGSIGGCSTRMDASTCGKWTSSRLTLVSTRIRRVFVTDDSDF